MTISQFGKTLNSCRDILTWSPNDEWVPRALASLRDTIGNRSITSCADVASYCNKLSYGVGRLWCPVTCGCHQYSSSLALPFPSDGCPEICTSTTSVWDEERANTLCVENSSALVSSSLWQQFVDNWLVAALG